MVTKPVALYATAMVITGAVLASNVVMWGADAEFDPAVFGAVVGLVRAARR